jgi:hypothetical protein
MFFSDAPRCDGSGDGEAAKRADIVNNAECAWVASLPNVTCRNYFVWEAVWFLCLYSVNTPSACTQSREVLHPGSTFSRAHPKVM